MFVVASFEIRKAVEIGPIGGTVVLGGRAGFHEAPSAVRARKNLSGMRTTLRQRYFSKWSATSAARAIGEVSGSAAC